MNSSSGASVVLPRGREQARIWTRPLRKLTPETSFGFEAVEFARRVLGRELHPWQRWFLIHSLELAPGSFTWDRYPQLRFKTVLLLVARQNGKSFIMSTRLLWRMIMWDGPEEEPALVLGSAHKLTAAREILELSITALKRHPEGRKHFQSAPMGSGNEHLQLVNGTRWRIEAASDDGGRSMSVTDLGFDELRQQREWDAWAALTNTTQARFSSQIIAVSNAGTAKSAVLRALRKQALDRIDAQGAWAGDLEEFAAQSDATLGIFEWSAPDGCPVDDIDGLAQANPSVGWPNENGEVLLTWDSLLAKAALVGKRDDDGVPEHVYRTETMCQWVVAAREGPFSEAEIRSCVDDESEIAEGSPVALAVDVSVDRSKSYLAVAGWRSDGLPHVEIIQERAGTEWLAKTLSQELEFEPFAVVAQGKGAPVSSVIRYIEGEGVKVTRCQGLETQVAATGFSDRLKRGGVRFRDDSSLMLALSEAVKKSFGDSWEWSRKASPVDVAPLIAAGEALWMLENEQLADEDRESAYGDDYQEWWGEGDKAPTPAAGDDQEQEPDPGDWWK